jgi:signal transduction histidine kinase
MVLTVTDDGAGRTETLPDDANPHEDLRALAYRADLIGATFTVERLSTQGTRVTCVFPFPGTKHAAKN